MELFNFESGTFFTPVGEMGLALHELYEVFGLPMGEIPCKEYVLTWEELHQLQAQDTLAYDTYWELLCHYHICAQITGLNKNGMKQKSWEEYLFLNLQTDDMEIQTLSPCTEVEKEERITHYGT